MLQAMALEDDMPDPLEDKTLPKYRQIRKRTASLVTEYGEEFKETFAALSRAKSSTKLAHGRKRGGAAKVIEDDDDDVADSKPPAKKRIKKEADTDGADGLTDKQMAELNDRGQISKQSVAALKDFLKARQQPAAGKKADLVDRVQEYLESKGL
jgi:ATP-dependent DNA helicase 2 subunit 1